MTTWRMVPCLMDGCRCGELHPAARDCDLCRGRGHFIGADEYHPCLTCTRRFHREFGPFVDALRELPTDEQRAREAAEDRVDVEAKGMA